MTSQNSSEPARIEPKTTYVPASCSKHGNFQAKQVVAHPGLPPLTFGCPQCTEERVIEERARKAEEQRRAEQVRIARLFECSGIPKRFEGKTLGDYVASDVAQKKTLAIANRYVQNFDPARGAALILCGKPGTGKTHIGCGIAHAVIETGHSAMFSTVLAAIRCIKDTYRRDSARSESEAIDDFLKPSLLVLDEVGAQVGSEHEKLLLFEIINERYQRCRSTILISNLTQAEIAEYLGDRVVDRFREDGAVVAFDWASYRGQR